MGVRTRGEGEVKVEDAGDVDKVDSAGYSVFGRGGLDGGVFLSLAFLGGEGGGGEVGGGRSGLGCDHF